MAVAAIPPGSNEERNRWMLRARYLLRRRFLQRRHVQPYLPRHRGSIAVGLPPAGAEAVPGADLLHHDLGPTEQFRRSRCPSTCLGCPPCSTASATPASTCSTRTKPSTSTWASSASRSAPTSI